MSEMLRGIFPGPISSKHSEPPRVDMAALESNHGIMQKLAAIAFLDDVPTKASDLDGTPYKDTANLEDNLDNNGCVEYKAALEPCFRTAARFGDSCYAEHT
ncbi:hypothetical protein WJX74_002558 [Apatococcus lobatus]|uniref:Uncharacterized protein n=1 Tax=Apatococcus lobatus TaxID=904363 RepID=A0AAW1QLB8_9CHLO